MYFILIYNVLDSCFEKHNILKISYMTACELSVIATIIKKIIKLLFSVIFRYFHNIFLKFYII